MTNNPYAISNEKVHQLYFEARDAGHAPIGWVGNELVAQDKWRTNGVFVYSFQNNCVGIQYLRKGDAYLFKKAAIEKPIHENE